MATDGKENENMHQNEAIGHSLVSIPHSNVGQNTHSQKKPLFKYVKTTLFRRDFFWLRNIYAHIRLLFPTFIEKSLIEFGPQTLICS